MNRANAIVEWREALTRLSDQHFFDLVRMYIGAVRTPFNKQKLIESLSAFLRNTKNRSRIVSCLDQFDRELLAAVRILPSPTREKIVQLFSGTRSFPEVYERILNLEERLLVYRNDEKAHREYAINPLLADEIEERAGLDQLIYPDTTGDPLHVPLAVSDSVLAGLYSFFLHEGPPVRNDGSLRKRTLDALASSFPDLAGAGNTLCLVVAALRNLSLLNVHDGSLVPDQARWARFARCDTASRAAYLCAAVYGRQTRDALQRNAQSFLDLVGMLAADGRYVPEVVNRAAYLVRENSGTVAGKRSRFSQMLGEHTASEDPCIGDSPDRAETARIFGLLAEQEGYLVPNAALSAPVEAATASAVISPSFETVLMPGSSLAELLPIVSCMMVTSIQTVGNYEINRKSCAAAFDQGETGDSLVALLKKHSTTPLPGNLLFSIQDWFAGYTALSLYHGYVLKVDDSRRVLFEKNESLTRLVRKTLAPGVYLLDTDSPEELQDAASRAGIDFLPSVARGNPRSDSAPLPPLRFVDLQPSVVSDRHKKSVPETVATIQAELVSALESLHPAKDQKDALLSRIQRKIVISPVQLDPESVRPEKMEARGMDFLGKVRVAEQAVATGSLLEIHVDSGNRILLGKPLSMEKKRGDMLIKLQSEADETIDIVSLGRAVLVRRLRGSIFSEPLSARRRDAD